MSAKLQLSRQQLSEFLKDPEAIKVMERLLSIGNGIRDNIFSQTLTITANTTIGLLDHLILIDTANAITVTIPAGCPIGHEVKITRLVASTNAVTVVRSGTETIEGGTTFITHGATVASTLNNSEVVLKKVLATAWRFVGGEISGSNANGLWTKFSNGMLICHGTAAPYQWADPYLRFHITSPYEFADLTYSVGFSFATGSSMTFYMHNQILNYSTTRFDLAFYRYTGTYTETKLSFIAIGRWK